MVEAWLAKKIERVNQPCQERPGELEKRGDPSVTPLCGRGNSLSPSPGFAQSFIERQVRCLFIERRRSVPSDRAGGGWEDHRCKANESQSTIQEEKRGPGARELFLDWARKRGLKWNASDRVVRLAPNRES